jgi:hypothetical protein
MKKGGRLSEKVFYSIIEIGIHNCAQTYIIKVKCAEKWPFQNIGIAQPAGPEGVAKSFSPQILFPVDSRSTSMFHGEHFSAEISALSDFYGFSTSVRKPCELWENRSTR